MKNTYEIWIAKRLEITEREDPNTKKVRPIDFNRVCDLAFLRVQHKRYLRENRKNRDKATMEDYSMLSEFEIIRSGANPKYMWLVELQTAEEFKSFYSGIEVKKDYVLYFHENGNVEYMCEFNNVNGLIKGCEELGKHLNKEY